MCVQVGFVHQGQNAESEDVREQSVWKTTQAKKLYST